MCHIEFTVCVSTYDYELLLHIPCLLFSTHSAAGLVSGDTVSLVKCADPLPLEQYFAVITAHFQVCAISRLRL